jgi:hypothetical protein
MQVSSFFCGNFTGFAGKSAKPEYVKKKEDVRQEKILCSRHRIFMPTRESW